MKKLIAITGLCLISLTAFADSKPSDASLEELLVVTESQKLMDGIWPQMERMMSDTAKRSTTEGQFTQEQKEVLDRNLAKMSAVIKEEFAFEKMKPMFINIYSDAFTQEEVDGMLKFYKSKAGQAVIKKMPQVMQGSMVMVQTQMQTLGPKIQKIQQEMTEEMKKTTEKHAGTAPTK
ncbi:DUF2059 domain-containing protein [Cellvibrio sp.]|uniref:DUF2059 domain-containing protein n=1 Tax=Cellvibrio sp. TaxID=1965322 RepID=UPI00396486A4